MAIYDMQLKETLSVADSAKAEVFRLIEENPSIPEHAKQVVKDFIAENWVSLVSNVIPYIPDEITEYFDIIVETVKNVMGL
jgi:hypothetical protein